MVQIYLQKENISEAEWATIYAKIESITKAYPTQLLRLESFYPYQSDLDKKHTDLYLHRNTDEECISIYGEFLSYTTGQHTIFPKNLALAKQYYRGKKEVDTSKPLIWAELNSNYTIEDYVPEMNGDLYWRSESALDLVLLSIGIVMEHEISGKAFVFYDDISKESRTGIVHWLEGHFNSSFKPPLYANRSELLTIWRKSYQNPKDIIFRFAQFYPTQYKKNIALSLREFDHDSTLKVYSQLLSKTVFNSFGFYDMVDGWIAATMDLESTLQLISSAKKQIEDDKTKTNWEEITERYDFKKVLKHILRSHILWTPKQRETLRILPNNTTFNETGEHSLDNHLMRLVGMGLTICPIYADETSLFEAFMYHNPKDGQAYKKIITEWLQENEGKYEELKSTLERQEEMLDEFMEADENDGDLQIQALLELIPPFLENYQSHERYLVSRAITQNLNILHIKNAVETLATKIKNYILEPEGKEFIANAKTYERKEQKSYILERVKTLKYAVHPDFEKALKSEKNAQVILFLMVLMALKIYNKNDHFVRFLFLWDVRYWKLFSAP